MTMKNLTHTSALPSHYDNAAATYDRFNEENSRIINQAIAQILKKHNVLSVLDMTCGTGSQIIFLAGLGFKTSGSDINANMLQVAEDNIKKENLDIHLMQGDMRTLKVGKFDAVITIFNAIGHLTKSDFEKAIKNVSENLKEGGIYIFDIFNLDYLLESNNITKLTIDWQKVTDNTKIRDIQYSTINKEGVLASYTIHSEQHGTEKPKMSQSEQTLQVYTAQQLKDLLADNNFEVLDQTDVDGSPLNEKQTERILTVAQKR